MTPDAAHRRAGFLRLAAIQFVVLTAIAMVLYAGGTWFDRSAPGYELGHNFFSDLGATHAWSGRANYASAALFTIALATMGVAFIAFAPAWRAFAFEKARGRALGIAAQLCGTLSGASFIAVAVLPIDHALHLHNTFVVAAFALLLGYAASMTLLMWRNGARGAQLVASTIYLVVVLAYVAMVVVAVRRGIATDRGVVIMVVAQKVITYASMLFVAYLTTVTRRLCQPA